MKNRGLYIYIWFLFVSVLLLALFVIASYFMLGLPVTIMLPCLLFCASGMVLLIVPIDTVREGIRAVTINDLNNTHLLLLALGCALAGFGFISLLFIPHAGLFMKVLFLLGFLFLMLKAVTLAVALYKRETPGKGS